MQQVKPSSVHRRRKGTTNGTITGINGDFSLNNVKPEILL